MRVLDALKSSQTLRKRKRHNQDATRTYARHKTSTSRKLSRSRTHHKTWGAQNYYSITSFVIAAPWSLTFDSLCSHCSHSYRSGTDASLVSPPPLCQAIVLFNLSLDKSLTKPAPRKPKRQVVVQFLVKLHCQGTIDDNNSNWPYAPGGRKWAADYSPREEVSLLCQFQEKLRTT